MATQYANGKIVTDGLVLSLNAADRNSYPGSGTTWTDMSGNGNNGTLTNGPTFSSANGGAIVFDGTNDYVATAGISATVSELTIATWLFVTEPQPNEYSSIVFSRSGNITGLHFLGIAFGGNGYKLSYTYNGSGYTWGGAPAVTPSVWNSVTLVFRSTGAFFYINGQFSASDLASLAATNLAALQIGRDSGTFGRYYKGNLATTQIYNRALSASEITQNYNAQKSRYGL
jgi:hypothetical protein